MARRHGSRQIQIANESPAGTTSLDCIAVLTQRYSSVCLYRLQFHEATTAVLHTLKKTSFTIAMRTVMPAMTCRSSIGSRRGFGRSS
jgi:hypothetical protein